MQWHHATAQDQRNQTPPQALADALVPTAFPKVRLDSQPNDFFSPKHPRCNDELHSQIPKPKRIFTNCEWRFQSALDGIIGCIPENRHKRGETNAKYDQTTFLNCL
jgi:hypothetical protein